MYKLISKNNIELFKTIFYSSLVFFVLAVASPKAIAQDQERAYKNAEAAFYDESFADAIILYNEVLSIDAGYKDAEYKMEICSLLLKENREKSLDKMLSYEDFKGKYDKFYYYWMGRIYANKYMFPEAVEAWKRFLGKKAFKSKEIVAETKDFIDDAEKLVAYFDNPDNYEIHQLENGINTSGGEFSPVYFEEKKELLFLSNNKSSDGTYNVYHSVHTDYNWSKPKEISSLGAFERENANIEVVNEDGKLFLFDDKKGSLLFSEPTANGWAPAVEFDSEISSKNLASHFFINTHEDRIIFSDKNRKTGLDLYESHRDPQSGKWTKPVILPETINSVWDEDSPYLSPDEQKLYFSSRRSGGVGGYDVYVSALDPQTKTWGEPENLGWPINSPDDDIHFKMNDDQESGYFISNRIYSRGDYDIFFFWQINKVFLEGKVVNALTEQTLTSGEIRFHPSQYLVEYFRSEIDENGKFRTEIISDEEFRVEVIDGTDTLGIEKYQIHDSQGEKITHVQDFYAVSKNATEEELLAFKQKTSGILGENQIPAITETPAETTSVKPALKKAPEVKKAEPTPKAEVKEEPKHQSEEKMEVEMLANKYRTSNKAILSNVYFEFGTSQLKPESDKTLNRLYETLKSNPQLKVEIAGHTDNVGKADVNLWLSENRAKAVKKWLIKKGIDKDRMIAKGYGETQPLASNDDEINGRELNRRIEILVIE